MIQRYWFKPTEDGKGVEFDIIPNKLNVCVTERFGNQIYVADCSGFLVGPDLLVTAGHCVEDKWDCDEGLWVFDFQMHENGANPLSFLKDQVYKCIEVITSKSDDFGDYALIRLDREVKERKPLNLRQQGIINSNDPLVAIGNPSGLPTKITDQGKVRTNIDPAYFFTTLDTFSGNSGSAVINSETGLVEGLLVSGGPDYTYNKMLKCWETYHCQENGCTGEGVQRISALLPFLK